MNNEEKIVLYKKPDWTTEINVRLDGDTIRLNQNQIAQLFDVDRTVVTRHISNIIKNWELEEKSNVQKMHFPHSDKLIKFYNLDFILAVWYRVNTKQWILFRRRSNEILKKYLLDGYALNQKRIKEIWFENFENERHRKNRTLQKTGLNYWN